MIGQKVNGWLKRVQSWVIPPVCLLCGAPAAESGLCPGCIGDLPLFGPGCRRCAGPLDGEICARCLDSPPSFDRTICLFRYQPPVDGLIQRLKFHRDLACARSLGSLMADHLLRLQPPRPDVMLPVPLHQKRLAARGYNQALEIARPIARTLGIPIDTHTCHRVRATAEQAALAAAARRTNVAGAFAVRGSAATHVAIVDDVMTTGHTLEAVASALKAAGVGTISLWVCARAG